MIFHVAHRELRETIRDGRFRWSASIILLLILVSFISGWDYLRTATRYEAMVPVRGTRTLAGQGRDEPTLGSALRPVPVQAAAAD